MYLAWRLPVAINVSYFYQFKDDPDRSRMTQVARAASLISGCMEFRDLLVSYVTPHTQPLWTGNSTVTCVWRGLARTWLVAWHTQGAPAC